MSEIPHLGALEEHVMRAILGLGNDAYGVPIRERLSTRAGREVSIGSLYATLDRLESKGLVASRLGEKTAERGGRAKLYYRVTNLGTQALEAAERSRNNLFVVKGVGYA